MTRASSGPPEPAKPAVSQGTKQEPAGYRRRLLIDVTPLRRSRDLRWPVAGELVSTSVTS